MKSKVDYGEEYKFGLNEPLIFSWSYLFFRVLLLSEKYEEYCVAKENAHNKHQLIAELENQFSAIERIYAFWGKVSDYEDIYTLDDLVHNRFRCWCAQHGHRLLGLNFNEIRVVPEWQNLRPKIGVIYFAVSDDWDLAEYDELYKSALDDIFSSIKNVASKFPPNRLNGVGIDYPNRIAATEQRLDAFEWKYIEGLDGPQCLDRALKSNKRCWVGIQNRVENARRDLPSVTLATFDEVPKKKLKPIRDDIAKLAKMGGALIQLTLQGQFPDYE